MQLLYGFRKGWWKSQARYRQAQAVHQWKTCRWGGCQRNGSLCASRITLYTSMQVMHLTWEIVLYSWIWAIVSNYDSLHTEYIPAYLFEFLLLIVMHRLPFVLSLCNLACNWLQQRNGILGINFNSGCIWRISCQHQNWYSSRLHIELLRLKLWTVCCVKFDLNVIVLDACKFKRKHAKSLSDKWVEAFVAPNSLPEPDNQSQED